MSYEPTTWVTGDIITATKLNNIESGVQSVSSSYTPTTWATGDIITATKLNNIEQGIANAGGGSSDFSTATVTVTGGTTSNDFPVYDNGTIDMKYMVNESATVVIGADGLVVSPPDGYASVSGAIQSLGKAGYLITGDCTITIS